MVLCAGLPSSWPSFKVAEGGLAHSGLDWLSHHQSPQPAPRLRGIPYKTGVLSTGLGTIVRQTRSAACQANRGLISAFKDVSKKH
jgi:hypothetical protein